MNTWSTALKQFYAFCIDKLELPIKDYAAKLDRPRQEELDRERRIHKPLIPETFNTIIGEAIRQQDYAWVIAARFKWETISRIGDLYHLRWEDIDFERMQVTCRQPKRGGVRRPRSSTATSSETYDDSRNSTGQDRRTISSAGPTKPDTPSDNGFTDTPRSTPRPPAASSTSTPTSSGQAPPRPSRRPEYRHGPSCYKVDGTPREASCTTSGTTWRPTGSGYGRNSTCELGVRNIPGGAC